MVNVDSLEMLVPSWLGPASFGANELPTTSTYKHDTLFPARPSTHPVSTNVDCRMPILRVRNTSMSRS